TPQMVELSPALCHDVAARGTVVVDTRDADHEAGDLIQAGMDVNTIAALAQAIREDWPRPTGPVLLRAAAGRAGTSPLPASPCAPPLERRGRRGRRTSRLVG